MKLISDIIHGCASLIEDGAGPNLVALLPVSTRERVTAYLEAFVTQHYELDSARLGPEIRLNGQGFSVRLVFDRFVPHDQFWVCEEPEPVMWNVGGSGSDWRPREGEQVFGDVSSGDSVQTKRLMVFRGSVA